MASKASADRQSGCCYYHRFPLVQGLCSDPAHFSLLGVHCDRQDCRFLGLKEVLEVIQLSLSLEHRKLGLAGVMNYNLQAISCLPPQSNRYLAVLSTVHCLHNCPSITVIRLVCSLFSVPVFLVFLLHEALIHALGVEELGISLFPPILPSLTAPGGSTNGIPCRVLGLMKADTLILDFLLALILEFSMGMDHRGKGSRF